MIKLEGPLELREQQGLSFLNSPKLSIGGQDVTQILWQAMPSQEGQVVTQKSPEGAYRITIEKIVF